jgi:IS5 family transposase
MGGKQLGFSDYELTTAKKQTKREKFLSEMEVVVPWQALIDVIEPHYPKANKKGGRPPYPLATMLGSIFCSTGTRSATRRWKRP